MKNAIILAAGKSTRFAPFTYEKPKGLFRVKSEILIERQIEQLKDAGIHDIAVVVGYMKEKFFYLEEKYGIKLVINNTFASNGNLYSLYVSRHLLANTFICCADHYFLENPFKADNTDNISWRHCSYLEGKFREFAVYCSDADVITRLSVGGSDQLAMVGCAYFNNKFSHQLRNFLEVEINDFGISNMFWEEFYAKHQESLTLYAKQLPKNTVLEFDSIDDLRQFDSEFLPNVDSRIIINICNILACNPTDIMDIKVIQAGLTNVSFMFTVNNTKYVYRHPGSTAGHLIDRETEVFTQYKAKELEIDKSVIYIDQSGWKISYYVNNLTECDFRKYPAQLHQAMLYLKKMHNEEIPSTAPVKIFDTVQEGKKLMAIASSAKGNLADEFAGLITKVERLNTLVEQDAKRLNIKRVLCHNDTYAPNYLATSDGDLYLIDWEYAGMNYPANDIACILCRDDYSDEETEEYLRAYFGRNLTTDEHRHYIAFIALCGFYWFCWGLYKGSVGDDDGFFFLPAYRSCIRYIDRALTSYNV